MLLKPTFVRLSRTVKCKTVWRCEDIIDCYIVDGNLKIVSPDIFLMFRLTHNAFD